MKDHNRTRRKKVVLQTTHLMLRWRVTASPLRKTHYAPMASLLHTKSPFINSSKKTGKMKEMFWKMFFHFFFLGKQKAVEDEGKEDPEDEQLHSVPLQKLVEWSLVVGHLQRSRSP